MTPINQAAVEAAARALKQCSPILNISLNEARDYATTALTAARDLLVADAVEAAARIAETFSDAAHIAHDMREGRFPKRSKSTDAIATAIRSSSPPPALMLWCCHVRGPDEVLPTADYDAAVKLADETNALFYKRPNERDEYDPIIIAMPALWPWSAEAHAEELAKAPPPPRTGAGQ